MEEAKPFLETSTVLLVLGVLAAIVVVGGVLRRLQRRVVDFGIMQAALQVERQIAVVADPALHDYAIVDEDAHHASAVAFVAEHTIDAEALGFTRLGDLEDRTLTRANPAARTPLRVLVDAAGEVVISVGARPPNDDPAAPDEGFTIVEIGTELADGRFVVTLILPPLPELDHAPAVLRTNFPPGTALAEAVAAHRQRVGTVVNEGAVVVATRTIDDIIQGAHRRHTLEVQARAHLPAGISLQELERLSGAKPEIAARVHAILVQRRVAADAGVPGADVDEKKTPPSTEVS